jgi:phosphate transport system substrate-binding protein
VEAAVAAGAGSIPANLAQPLILETGDQSYPIVNFEYIVVKSTQASADVAQAIRTFLAYAIDPAGGSSPSYLASKQFEALPSSVVPQVQTAIAKITG